jgi:hypothetical protein
MAYPCNKEVVEIYRKFGKILASGCLPLERGVAVPIEFNHTPASGRGTAVLSLVAVMACAAAVDPGQIAPSTDFKLSDHGLSLRIESLAKQIRKIDPLLSQSLSPSVQLAQWRNY